MVHGLDSAFPTLPLCEGCIAGKQWKLPFPRVPGYHATTLLGLVHSDLCGPMQVTSLGGSRYCLTFIDDFSRFADVYFLRHKSEVFHYIFSTLQSFS